MNTHTQTIAFIDNARKLEREFAELGDMHTAAILAGIADSEEHYLMEDIDREWETLSMGYGA